MQSNMKLLSQHTLNGYGGMGEGMSLQLARAMASRISGADLVMMKRTGHLANLERPERFNEILLEFLLRHNPK